MEMISYRKTIVALGLLTGIALCVAIGTSGNGDLSDSLTKPDQDTRATRGSNLREPVLPEVILETKYERPAGKVITLRRGGDFQAALNTARPGDQIVLEAGAEFQGNFKLPRKEGNRWIVIRSSAPDSSMPEGVRVSPSQSKLMPKLLSPNSSPVIRTSPGAHHYRFIGIELSIADSVSRISSLISLGDDDQTSLDSIPHDIIFDRCFIHGSATASLRRGIALNSARTSVIDSYISDCHERGADSQA
ncbi:MAG TPA: hypothetical protein VFQ92_14240, partial [Blastocatellia bacterium]|nr:hypothetical protein [Blastocatellia bacterium]